MNQEIQQKLEELAKRKCFCDTDDFNTCDFFGANYDDSYWGGFDDGYTKLAREILDTMKD